MKITTVDGFDVHIDDDQCHLDERLWVTVRQPNGKRLVQEVGFAKTRTGFYGPYLHRLVARAGKGQRVSHLNGDGFDCQRANLKVTTTKRAK